MVEKVGEGPAYTERINATAGQRITVMARLIKGPSTEPPQQRDAQPAPPSIRPIDTTPPPADPGPPPSDAAPRWQPIAAWTAAGVAAVAIGFGAVELLSSNSKFREFNSKTECGGNFKDRGGPACNALYEDAASARRLSIVGFTVGGVLAATSVVLFLLTPEQKAHESVSLACAPALGGISCGGRF
jgi:hypothetical protein